MSRWEEAAADAEDVKADTIEQAVVALTRIAGLYRDSSSRRHEVLSFVNGLETDADNFRAEAKRLRGAGPSLELVGGGE